MDGGGNSGDIPDVLVTESGIVGGKSSSPFLERFLVRMKKKPATTPRSCPATPLMLRKNRAFSASAACSRRRISRSPTPSLTDVSENFERSTEEEEEAAAEEAEAVGVPLSTLKKSLQLVKLWRWFRSRAAVRKTSAAFHQETPSRRHSVETHGNRRYRVDQRRPPTDADLRVLHEHQRQRQHQQQPRGGSWAEITVTMTPSHPHYNRCADLFGSTTLDSGYHSRASLSTPTSPRVATTTTASASSTAAAASLQSKSRSVEVGTKQNGISSVSWRSEDSNTLTTPPVQQQSQQPNVKERRRQFQQWHQTAAVVSAVAEVEESSAGSSLQEDCLGEWRIPADELTFLKRIVAGGEFGGHDIYSGRWHGDVVIHSFRNGAACLEQVRALTQIRHENLVLYMGASVEDLRYNIVTNPVKAQSLHSRLRAASMPRLDEDYTVSVSKQLANAVGYLHAKDIVHGRISSRNVFLERKVQLSLLDYGVGASNVAYSSPQVIAEAGVVADGGDGSPLPMLRGSAASDDVFAFGTLLFELFSSRLPLADGPEGDDERAVAARIASGSLPRALSGLQCTTERLRKLIQGCWAFDAARRPSFAQMARHHFVPGYCLLRRQSTSEPRMDQVGNGN